MIDELTEPFTWEKYSRRVRQKISTPQNFGSFSEKDLHGRSLRLLTSTNGQIERGALMRLFWLVDPEDGVIVDARYQLFGPTVLVASLEACMELVVGKNYDQARRISIDLLEKHLRDTGQQPALPKEASAYLRLITEALETLASQCTDIALASQYTDTPLPDNLFESDGGIADWPTRPEEEKLAIVRVVIERDVRPYVEMDAGGVEAIRLEQGFQVIIAYSGNCDGCFSSTGATLSSIQAILRAKIHPSIEVVPEL